MKTSTPLIWQPWQRRFRAAVKRHAVSCLSVPRGNGKTTLAAHLLREALLDTSTRNANSYIVAGSIGQARRTTWAALRQLVDGDDEVRVYDTAQACHLTHLPSSNAVHVMASNSRRALGLLNVPIVVGDEPGSWDGGAELYEALSTGLGKPGCTSRLVLVGTLAPAAPEDWWPQLVASGSTTRRHVTLLQGDPDRWDRAAEIRRVNPLMWSFPESRATLLEERDEARRRPAQVDSFRRMRMNVPGAVADTMLLTAADWQTVLQRDPAAVSGFPIVGVDLGAAPSWSAAVAIWPSGRTAAVAVVPGVPDLEAQEKRDRAPRGSYRQLVDDGAMIVADGLRAPSPKMLIDVVLSRWQPRYIIADRFRQQELMDSIDGRCLLEPRIPRWSTSTEDISAFRRAALDSGMSVDPNSRGLLTLALSVARVRNDDSGNIRMTKGAGHQHRIRRDDVAAALLFASGGHARRPAAPSVGFIAV